MEIGLPWISEKPDRKEELDSFKIPDRKEESTKEKIIAIRQANYTKEEKSKKKQVANKRR